MFTNLNKKLRKLFLALGAVFALFKLIEKIGLQNWLVKQL